MRQSDFSSYNSNKFITLAMNNMNNKYSSTIRHDNVNTNINNCIKNFIISTKMDISL